MKKALNIAFAYAIIGLASGVYYRELTKIQGFTGDTQLSVLHTHLFVIGMIMMLIIYLFSYIMKIHEDSRFNAAFYLYNGGVIVTTTLMAIRGTLQVLEYEFSTGLDASISGIAGIGHILVAIGLIFFFVILRKNYTEKIEKQ